MSQTDLSLTPCFNLPRTIISGIIGGFASGLLGVGGGVVMVPLLVYFAMYGQRKAQATSLLAIIPISITALVLYGAAGLIDFAAAGALILGSMYGANRGAVLLTKLPENMLKIFFSVVLFGSAVALFLKA